MRCIIFVHTGFQKTNTKHAHYRVWFTETPSPQKEHTHQRMHYLKQSLPGSLAPPSVTCTRRSIYNVPVSSGQHEAHTNTPHTHTRKLQISSIWSQPFMICHNKHTMHNTPTRSRIICILWCMYIYYSLWKQRGRHGGTLLAR